MGITIRRPHLRNFKLDMANRISIYRIKMYISLKTNTMASSKIAIYSIYYICYRHLWLSEAPNSNDIKEQLSVERIKISLPHSVYLNHNKSFVLAEWLHGRRPGWRGSRRGRLAWNKWRMDSGLWVSYALPRQWL